MALFAQMFRSEAPKTRVSSGSGRKRKGPATKVRPILVCVAFLVVYIGENVYRTRQDLIRRGRGLHPRKEYLDSLLWGVLASEDPSETNADCFEGNCEGHEALLFQADSEIANMKDSPVTKTMKIREMLLRTIRNHNVRSIIDVPCSSNAHWMPDLLVLMDYEVPALKYTCIEENEQKIQRLRKLFKRAGNVKFIASTYWKQTLPKADLALSISSLQYMNYSDGWSFVMNMKQSNVKSILIESNNCEMNHPEPFERDHLNVMRSPFRFKEPKERYMNITTREDGLQTDLMLYDVDTLPLL